MAARHDVREDIRYEKLRHLLDYERIFSFDELYKASRKCSSGVMWKGYVQRFHLDRIGRCDALVKKMEDPFSYEPRICEPFLLNERGHKRTITPVHFDDRVVQRALCQLSLSPLLEHGLVADNAASQAGKGTDYARKRFQEKLARSRLEFGKSGCVVLYDFENFFGSISSERAMDKIAAEYMRLARTPKEKLNAEKLVTVTKAFVCQHDRLTLGNQTSQAAAIWYPSSIDHWIAEVKGYKSGRYMDDGYAFISNVKQAERFLSELDDKTRSIGLVLNTRKTRIEKLDHSITFLKRGCRFNPELGRIDTWVSPETLRRFEKHYSSVAGKVVDGTLELKDLEACFASFNGVLSSVNSKSDRQRIERSIECVNSEVARVLST